MDEHLINVLVYAMANSLKHQHSEARIVQAIEEAIEAAGYRVVPVEPIKQPDFNKAHDAAVERVKQGS